MPREKASIEISIPIKATIRNNIKTCVDILLTLISINAPIRPNILIQVENQVSQFSSFTARKVFCSLQKEDENV